MLSSVTRVTEWGDWSPILTYLFTSGHPHKSLYVDLAIKTVSLNVLLILLINIPCFNSGGQDGAVAIWEWAHATQVSTVRFVLFFFSLFSLIPAIFRPAGVFAKVNRIVFTQQGNKFGVCDGDGNTALWQVGIFAIKGMYLSLFSCPRTLP